MDPAGLSTPLSQQLSPRNSPGRTPAAAAMATEGWGSWGSPWPGGTGTPASLSLPSGRKNQGREAALSPAGARVLTGHRLSPFWKDLLPLHEEHDSAGRAQAGTKEIGALLPALPSPRTAPGKSLPLYSHGRAGLRLRVPASAHPAKGSRLSSGTGHCCSRREAASGCKRSTAPCNPSPANCIRSACAPVHALN